jgi:hypothetical protein
MTRSLRLRIERLEGDQGRAGIPQVIVATCPMPDDGRPLSTETVERWLANGVAHIAFKGHAVLYNGGRRKPLTIEEWQAQHCTEDADKSVH